MVHGLETLRRLNIEAVSTFTESKADLTGPMIPTVVVIKDGVTESVEICEDGEAAELAFAREVSCYGVEAGEQDYDDGYIELEDATICICWATNNSKQSINK